MTWRGRAPGTRPLPARPVRAAWKRLDWPPIEWWTGRVDVVHGTNYVVPPSRRAAALASVHDLTAMRFPNLCTADTLEYPGLIRRALDRGAHVHCDSRFVADELIDWSGCDRAVVHVVYPGIPPLRIANLEQTAAPFGNRPYVLALGTVEPRKDHATLVRAFATTCRHDNELLLVIAGADGWGESVSSMIHGFPESIRARIVREVDVDDARRDVLVANARILVYPSVYEGFGFPPLEAMSMGVPVVATDAGSLPEVLGQAAMLVPVGDSERLAEELLGVHTDEVLRSDLIARGAIRAAEFSWNRCAGEMAALYETIAGLSR